MTTRPNPGTLEVEWLGTLKPYAEEIGEAKLGFPIDWRVESGLTSSADRPDVVVERRKDRVALLSCEAKRPNVPEGAHPLIDSEVAGAIKKAQAKGLDYCFTTNFHQIALLEAGPGMASPVTRLIGNLIPFIPEALAKGSNWWRDLSDADRRTAVTPGLRVLLGTFHQLTAGTQVTKLVDDVVIDFLTRITDELVEPLGQTFITGPWATAPALRSQALAAGLDTSDKQDSRYFILGRRRGLVGHALLSGAPVVFRGVTSASRGNFAEDGAGPRIMP